MANDKLGIFIMGFITLVVGLVLLGSLADNIFDTGNIYSETNETLTVTSSAGQTVQDDVTSVAYFGNFTQDLTSNVTAEIINISRAGVIVTGVGITDGGYNISYSYESDLYVANSTSRILLRLIIIFFAIALILVAIAMFRKMSPEMFG